MKIRISGSRVLVFAFFAGSLAGQWISYPTAGVPRTSDGKPDLAAACPRTADGKPDFSGLWIMQTSRQGNANFPGCEPVPDAFINIASTLKDGLSYQPWAADLVKTRRTQDRVYDPLSHCLPVGPVRLHTLPGLRKMIQTPGLLVIMNEMNASYRQIFTDSRPLPEDPNPSWNGYSTARWDGDTLVVQTSGFRDGLWLDATGNPMSDAAKLTERFRRVNFGHMEIEITVDDPKAYTKPWTVKLNQTIKLDTDLLDFICVEGEKDSSHLTLK